jgi:putative DNA primase/helicase
MNFEQTLRMAGLHPRVVEADGKIRRCASELKPNKRNGWYVLNPDGRGSWGDWTTGSGEALGHWSEEKSSSVAQSAQAIERMRQHREAERQSRIKAMRRARDFWCASKPIMRVHPYLENKGLSPRGCAGLRAHDGLLVVPVWHGDWIISVQTIAADGTKRFWPGAPVKAGAFVLNRERAAVTALVEGLATGLAVYQSLPQAKVIVAFDAGNLLPVAQRIKPHGNVVVVADNDHGTEAKRGTNPGIEKARNTADLLGCGIWWPEGIEGTDAADCVKEWGERAAKRLEREILKGARYVATPC